MSKVTRSSKKVYDCRWLTISKNTPHALSLIFLRFLLWNRDYELALRYLNEGIAYATEHDLESCKSYMTMARARVHFETGRWTMATDDAASVLGQSRGYSVTRIPALTSWAIFVCVVAIRCFAGTYRSASS